MNIFGKQVKDNLIKQEAFILDETRKDSKIENKQWKKNRIIQVLALIFVIMCILSIVM